jgi:CheY-like chemotaxis protein
MFWLSGGGQRDLIVAHHVVGKPSARPRESINSLLRCDRPQKLHLIQYLRHIEKASWSLKMSAEYTVWLVDDLPTNLTKFKENHTSDFKQIETFAKPKDVLDRLRKGDEPDALLIDVFFYETPERAREVEDEVAGLVENLKKKAANLGLMDHKYAAGIALMEQIHKHYKNRKPPFPMYAYTSKGPFLLEQKDWQNISTFGAEVLLKGKVAPDSEVVEIVGDIQQSKLQNSWRVWLKSVGLKSAIALWPGSIWFFVGYATRWLFGH